MLPCHVILRYSIYQTKLHANFHIFTSFSDVGLVVFMCVCWAFDWARQRKERFFSSIFFCLFSFSLWNQRCSIIHIQLLPFVPFDISFLFTSILILVFPTSFFHPENLLHKWGKRGCLGHFFPCSLVCHPSSGAFCLFLQCFVHFLDS